jgi:hypothetical protein
VIELRDVLILVLPPVFLHSLCPAMSFPLLDRLLESLQRAHAAGDSRGFARALVCSPRDGEGWTALKTELGSVSVIPVTFLHQHGAETRVKNPTGAPTHLQTTLRKSPLLPFLNTLIAYLLATSWNPQEPSPATAEREWKTFDAVYAEANRLFTAGGAEGAGYLGRGMRKMAENLMHLAFRVRPHPSCPSRCGKTEG